MGDNSDSTLVLSKNSGQEQISSGLTSISASTNVTSSEVNNHKSNQRSRKPRTPRSLSQMSEEFADEPIDEDVDEDEDDEDADENLDEMADEDDEEIDEDLEDSDQVSSAMDAKLLQQLETSGASEQLKQLLSSSLLSNNNSSSAHARSQLINALMNSGNEFSGLDAATLTSLANALTNAANSNSIGSVHSPNSNESNLSTGSPPLRNLSSIRKKRSQSQNATSNAISTSLGDSASLNDSMDLTTGSGGSGGRSKVFECKICHHRFGYKHVLQNHERIHTGEKPFMCLECNKRFTRDHHLKTHMRLHTGEKPFPCTHCDKRFVQIANLRRHLRVHTGEKPYACEVPNCNSKFSDSNQLKAHMLIHRGEKPYRCEKCSGFYRRRHHLNHHKCPMDQANVGKPRRGRRPRAYDSSSATTGVSLDMSLSTAMSITPPPPSMTVLDNCSVSSSPASLAAGSSLFSSNAPSAISASTPDPIKSSQSNALSGLLAAAAAAAASNSSNTNSSPGFGNLSNTDLTSSLAGLNQLSGQLAALASSNSLLMAAAAANSSPVITAMMSASSPVPNANHVLSRNLAKQQQRTINSTTTNLALNSSQNSNAPSPRPSSTSAVSTSVSASSVTVSNCAPISQSLLSSSPSPVSSSSGSNSNTAAAVAANTAQQLASQLLQQRVAAFGGLTGLSSLISPYSIMDQRLLSSLLQQASTSSPTSLAPTSTSSNANSTNSALNQITQLTGLNQLNVNQLNQINQMNQQFDQLRQLTQLNQLNQLGGLLNIGNSNATLSSDTMSVNTSTDAGKIRQRLNKNKTLLKRGLNATQTAAEVEDLLLKGQMKAKLESIFGQTDLDKGSSNQNHLPLDFSAGKQSPSTLIGLTNDNNNGKTKNEANNTVLDLSRSRSDAEASDPEDEMETEKRLAKMSSNENNLLLNNPIHTFGQLNQTDLLSNLMGQQLLMSQLQMKQHQQQRVPPTPAGSEPEASQDEEELETDEQYVKLNNNNDDLMMDCDVQHQSVRLQQQQQQHHLNGLRKAAALLGAAYDNQTSELTALSGSDKPTEQVAFTAEQLEMIYRKRSPISTSNDSSLQNIVPSHLLDRAKNLNLNGSISTFGDTSAGATLNSGIFEKMLLQKQQQLADVNMMMLTSGVNSRSASPTTDSTTAVRGSLRNLQRHMDHNANETNTSIVANIAKS